MADPVGVLGTAVGVVSLGLQVYGTLKQYLDDFNSRDERVAKTLAYLAQLKGALNVVEAATQSLQAQHQAPSDMVLSCLRSCLAEMNALQGKLQEVGPSQQINVKEKIKEIKKKLKYPFQISNIDEIEKSLERIIGQLSLAIHGLELHSHLRVSTNVDALGDAIKSQTDVLARIKSDADTNQQINTSNATQLTGIINMSIQPLRPMIQSLESVTRDRFDNFENQVHSNHSVTTARLDVLESRTEANAQTMTEMLNILRHINNQPLSMDQEHIERRLVGTLVLKPSLLGDMYRSYDFQQRGIKSTSDLDTSISKRSSRNSTQRAPATSRFCGCSSWRSTDDRVMHWRTFYFFSKEEIVSTHCPGCSRYAGDASQRRRTFGVTYAGLQRLLSAAVSVSLCLDYGAGGASISPIFRYHSVVDETQSPPFRMLGVLCWAWSFFDVDTQELRAITMDYISYVNIAYSKRVASPRDVTVDGLTLMDNLFNEFRYEHKRDNNLRWAVSALFDSGVIATKRELVFSTLGSVSRGYTRLDSAKIWDGQIVSLSRLGALDFLNYGDIVCQFSEISAAVEAELDPIGTALMHKDLNILSQILATKPEHGFRCSEHTLSEQLMQLAVRWPAGLSHILEAEPCFFDSTERRMLLRIFTITKTATKCREEHSMYHDCCCCESTKILLEHGCPLPEVDLCIIFSSGVSTININIILRHLQAWRKRLRETLQIYLPVDPQEKPTAHEPSVLDHDASCAVKKLRAIGQDPYEMFGLQRGDYRLRSSLPGSRSIFHIIRYPKHAQIAFDLGFRDVDVPSGGVTPLSKAVRCLHIDYWKWLLDHGADYTRALAWTIQGGSQRLDAVDCPKYSILHWIFRTLPQYKGSRDLSMDSILSSATQSPWVSHFTQSSRYDRCSSLHQTYSKKDFANCINNSIDTLVGATEQFAMPVESVIRCITFHRLGIRHTCCASIPSERRRVLPNDYGSDFDELREEDEDRVHQLDELVTDFMNQYNDSGLSPRDFINGPWIEQMDRLEAEEESKGWTTKEKEMLLSIGVLPKQETESTESQSNDEDEDGEEYENPRTRPEYWKRQFEIIVNGGRSVEEG
ncbi:hypothetical protein F4824DRAFT_513049 [Ustulina deusta]|nr:hypothetical protein F4824DRAFT_513049 [Ustulina deusta]